ncbi:MAG: RDD family protein [Desulfobacteraceae bacterium]|jgi:uncharacterized RDD family membrane protein YckC
MQDHKLTIRTPEGVTFTLPLAGPVSRTLAWIIDAAGIMACYQFVQVGIGLLGMISPDFSSAFSIFIFFVLRTGYSILLEWFWRGQTVGKRVMGLRVMDVNGLRLQPSQIIIRNLLRMVDSLPLFYLLGGVMCLITRHSQRLGDLAANTIVVTTGKSFAPDLDLILEENAYNSLHAYPHLTARLRQQVVPEEAGIALQALMRRNELLPEARVALFDEIAGHFKSKVAFPQEAVEGVSDEQYVRNVVDVLFKASA